MDRTWDNRKELRVNGQYRGWTRRAKWFSGPPVRIKFEDEDGTITRTYVLEDHATSDWNRFKLGELKVWQMRG